MGCRRHNVFEPVRTVRNRRLVSVSPESFVWGLCGVCGGLLLVLPGEAPCVPAAPTPCEPYTTGRNLVSRTRLLLLLVVPLSL